MRRYGRAKLSNEHATRKPPASIQIQEAPICSSSRTTEAIIVKVEIRNALDGFVLKIVHEGLEKRPVGDRLPRQC